MVASSASGLLRRAVSALVFAIASNQAATEERPSKEAALRGLDVPFADGMRIEGFLSQIIARTDDAREGPLAFAQKRKPDYQGR